MFGALSRSTIAASVLVLALCQPAAASPGESLFIAIEAPTDGTATNSKSIQVLVALNQRRSKGGDRETPTGTLEVLADGLVVRSVRVRGGASSRVPFNLDISGYSDGRVKLQARFRVGSVRSSAIEMSAPVNVTVDRTPPLLRLSSPTPDFISLNQARVVAQMEFVDELSGIPDASVKLTLDGHDVTDALNSTSLSASYQPETDLAESRHRYTAFVSDRAGNSVSASADFDVTFADAATRLTSNGGQLTLADGPFAGSTITVPAGAVADPVTISARVVPDWSGGTEPILELRPHGVLFRQPVTLALPSQAPVFESILRAVSQDSDWESVPSERCDADLRCVTTQSFSYWVVRSAQLCRFTFGTWTCRSFAALAGNDVRSAFGSQTSAFAPVLLVHGFQLNFALDDFWCGLGTDDYWGGVPRLLSAVETGADVWQIRFDTGWSHDVAAEAVAEAVGWVLDVTLRDGVVLIAHSQGGLVARHYLNRFGGTNVRRLITIGTPHAGTTFGVGRCSGVADLRPDRVAVFNATARMPALRGEGVDYVLLAGRVFEEDRRNPVCRTLVDSDWVVDLDSQRGHGVTFPNAIRLTFDRYRHTQQFLYTACGEQPEIPDQLASGVGHELFQAVRDYARVRAGQSSTFLSLNDPLFGIGSITRDTRSGLDWLDLTRTVGRSYADLVGLDGTNEFAPGALFYGFRYATFDEVIALWAHAGLSSNASSNTPEFQLLFRLLGGPLNGGIANINQQIGVSGSFWSPGLLYAPLVGFSGGSAFIGTTHLLTIEDQGPYWAHWLVRVR